ncbi:LOW QUALITY PROTEIN: major facilitator superfamily domain-containing protein [Microdochium trichocladiopsis]|uniref:Major facilitator superfamily domain-containing protein n=1 Tax=Microdochium trichocladiopsis TaxID=1682393 RepID=A0A9P8XSQ9_9PEZI|nr:LOW QUALITY PROTEIN: major facilitator superfamily domain-containing protein [Microdochium trichocladiopsis]KAH7014530.1 LOW QUALITY PROTEIN: major facilitator superfamily domain-containing protein [Microdochium trichocladiopsis]
MNPKDIDSEKAEQQSEPEKPPRDISVTAFSLCFSIFLYSLDTTVVAASIVTDFDALSNLAWINVGFLLGGTAFTMIWGQVYGQFNSKWVYLSNVLLFEAGSALCGAAPNMNAHIVGRVICGIGGSGLYSGVFTLIAQTTTMAERPLYISWTGLTWGIGIVLGPVVGGAFNQSYLGWRWAFYINLFIGALCAPVWFLLLPSKDPRPGIPTRVKLRELDYAGMVLLVGSLICLTFAINFGGVTYPWNSGTTIGLLVTFAVLLALLAIQQIRTILVTLPRRLVPVQLARQPIMLVLFICTSASSAVFIPIFFVPLLFQLTRGDTGLDAGVRLLPLIITLVFAIAVNGALMARFGYYMPWYLGGGILCVVGGALMYTSTSSTGIGTTSDNTTTTPAAAIYGYTVLIGLGVGSWIQASFSVAQAKAEPANVPAAIGLMTLAQFLGITTGMAIASSVFLNLAQQKVVDILGGGGGGGEGGVSRHEVEVAIMFAGSSSGGGLAGQTEEVRKMVVGAIVQSIGSTYVLVVTAGAMVAVLSLFMKRERLFISATAGGG